MMSFVTTEALMEFMDTVVKIAILKMQFSVVMVLWLEMRFVTVVILKAWLKPVIIQTLIVMLMVECTTPSALCPWVHCPLGVSRGHPLAGSMGAPICPAGGWARTDDGGGGGGG